MLRRKIARAGRRRAFSYRGRPLARMRASREVALQAELACQLKALASAANRRVSIAYQRIANGVRRRALEALRQYDDSLDANRSPCGLPSIVSEPLSRIAAFNRCAF